MTLDVSDLRLFIFKPPSVVLWLHEESSLLERIAESDCGVSFAEVQICILNFLIVFLDRYLGNSRLF